MIYLWKCSQRGQTRLKLWHANSEIIQAALARRKLHLPLLLFVTLLLFSLLRNNINISSDCFVRMSVAAERQDIKVVFEQLLQVILIFDLFNPYQ